MLSNNSKNSIKEKLNELRCTRTNLVIGDVTCYTDEYLMEDLGRSFGGYQMTSNSYQTTKKKHNSLLFVVEQLEKVSKNYNCNAFDDNRIKELNARIDELLRKLDGNDEATIKDIKSIYILISEELTSRLINLCDYISKNNLDSEELTYNEIIFKNTQRFYQNKSVYKEVETIDNYFNSLIDGACSFIERVTGNDIRKDIYSRLDSNKDIKVKRK